MKTITLFCALVFMLCAAARAENDAPPRQAFAAPSDEIVAQITPILMRVLNAPVPVKGSDGRYHLVYELEVEASTTARHRP